MARLIGKSKAVRAQKGKRTLYGMGASTWWLILQNMDTEERTPLAAKLTSQYPGFDPKSDSKTAIWVDMRPFQPSVAGAIDIALRKENIMVDELEFELEDDNFTADEVEETSAPAKKTRTRKAKKNTGVVIPEGYGDQERGVWTPGYDAKWKSALIKRVDSEGDQAAADEMVQRKWWTQEVADERINRFHNPPAKAIAAPESAASAANRAAAEEGLDDIDLD